MYLFFSTCITLELLNLLFVLLQERVINHAAGSHGVSGIFMKYDLSSLMVRVTEQHMPLWQFLVRLCGIIGGIFSTTGTIHILGSCVSCKELYLGVCAYSVVCLFFPVGMLHRLVGFFVDTICCRFKLGVYKPKQVLYLFFYLNFLK